MLRTTSVESIVLSAAPDTIGPKSNFHGYEVASPIGNMSGGTRVEGLIRGGAGALALLLTIGGCAAIPPNAPLPQSFVVHLSLADVTDPVTRKHLQAIPTGLDLSQEDAAMRQVAEDYMKASGNKLDYSIMPFMAMPNPPSPQTATAGRSG